jgi:hypothetical protein
MCTPGTDNEVISMVIERSKKIDPLKLNIRRAIMNLVLNIRN